MTIYKIAGSPSRPQKLHGREKQEHSTGADTTPAPKRQKGVASRPTPERRTYTAKETAEMLGVSLKTLSRWQRRGLLVPLKVSRKKLYTKEAIERFLEEVK